MYVTLFMSPVTTGAHEHHAVIDLVQEMCLEADQLGFATIYLSEHHQSGHNTYCDPYMLGSWLAPQLRQAYIGISVMCAPFHHPLRMVEYCNVLDVLTKGRCIIGLAPGVPSTLEISGFGIDREDTRAMTQQRMEVMLRIWERKEGDPPLDVSTDWDKGSLVGQMMPTSYRKPHPLFGRGTTSDETVVECGRRGLPVMFGVLFGVDENSRRQLALYREALEEGGHSAETIEECMRWVAPSRLTWVTETEREAAEIKARLVDAFRPPPGAAGKGPFTLPSDQFIDRTQLIGTPDMIVEKLQEIESEIDVHHVRVSLLRSPSGVYRELEEDRRSYRLFVEEVLPRLNPESLPGPRLTADMVDVAPGPVTEGASYAMES